MEEPLLPNPETAETTAQKLQEYLKLSRRQTALMERQMELFSQRGKTADEILEFAKIEEELAELKIKIEEAHEASHITNENFLNSLNN